MSIRGLYSLLAFAGLAMGYESGLASPWGTGSRPKRGNDTTDGDGVFHKTGQNTFRIMGMDIEALNMKNAQRKAGNELKKLEAQTFQFGYDGYLYLWKGEAAELRLIGFCPEEEKDLHPHIKWLIRNGHYTE